MDLLLSHGYRIVDDAHEQKVMKPYPPLGLLYLSAFLKAAGFGVAVFDTTFATRSAVLARLATLEAPVLGLYTNLMTRASVLQMIAEAKAHGFVVVLGGPESANYPAHYLASGADVVVFGEGEEALAALLPAIAEQGVHRLHGVEGIAFRAESGEMVRTAPRAKLRFLDALPWPDREAIDLEAYLACWREHHGAGSVNLITARGCPYKCRWCSHSVFGYAHARRSPEDVAGEVAFIRERYAPELAWYADDVFTISPRWLGSFAQVMSRRGLHLPFECITRADRVNPEVVERMRELGCYRVWLGSESGSQRILDAMERGVTVDAVRAATRLFQSAGIQVGMFLMWGYEGETLADVEETIAHVKLTNPDVFLTTVAYPIKGTPYFDSVADRVVPTRIWALGSDRDYAISGRHSQRYYRFVTQRLKHEVALHRLRRLRPFPAFKAARVGAQVLASRIGMRLTADELEADKVAIEPTTLSADA